MLAIYLAALETDEEQDAFARLYEKRRYHCFRAALRITRSEELAEDAVHEAFLAAMRTKVKFFALPRNKQDSRIVIMAKNKAIDIMRGKFRSALPLDEIGEIDGNAAPGNGGIDFLLAYEESMDRLTQCVSKLDEIHKTAFEMRYALDMANGEIAAELGMTANAVAVRLNRARAALRKIIDREGIYDA
ncbi:MAG: RNA polymerase sigma factor [Clostridiales Family XIII bacterium]|jgi:RNA polymerase sigma-70 factor (ECF subfamily)|nr:RNA polymerase sigma factor [Clostridiales Family XIII bacterium]